MDGQRGRLGRREFLAGVGAVGLGALAGCRGVGGGTASTLRVATLEPPVTLDPITAKSVGSRRAIRHVFDGLYTYDEGTNLVSRIADGPPEAEDDRTVSVTLDPDARFQDGSPVTPADVRYSLEAPVSEDTPAKSEVSGLAGVERVDGQTVRLRFDAAATRDRTLTRPVVPEAVRERDREQFATDPVGSGPFVVESFSEEKRLVLTRWRDYWGSPAPSLDRVTVRYVESPITQMASLRTRRNDVLLPVSPHVQATLPSVAGAEMDTGRGYRSLYFGFNANDGPTADPDVRRAVARCIDVDRAVRDFVEPLGRRQYGPVAPRVAAEWDFPRAEWREQSPGKDIPAARRQFDRADRHVGKLTILTSKHPTWKEFAHRLAGGIRDAGESAIVDAVGWKTYLERYVSGAADDYAVFVGDVAGTPDPDSFLYPAFHENVQGLTNGTFYNDEAVMRDILEARRATDRERRRERYASATQTLLDERVFLPVCSLDNSLAHDESVRGLGLHPLARHNPRLVGPTGAVSRRDG